MAALKANKISQKVPSLNEFEDTVLFIEDEILRDNIVLTLQHVYFIISIIDELQAADTSIANGLYKDLTLHTAAVVESSLHYCLRRYVDSGEVDSSRVMGTENKLRNRKKLYELSDNETLFAAIEVKSKVRLTRQTKFKKIHEACRKAGIIDKRLESRVSRLREERNNIHLAGLRLVDNSYTRRDAQRAVKLTVDVMNRVQNKLAT